MIAMFDIFTLLYKEAKELISKWFIDFQREKRKNALPHINSCSKERAFMAEMRVKGRRKMGQRSNDIVGKDAAICSLFLYIYTQIKIYNGLL